MKKIRFNFDDGSNNKPIKSEPYNGWLVSNSFLKRSSAILGYNIFNVIMIWLFVIAFFILVVIIEKILGR